MIDPGKTDAPVALLSGCAENAIELAPFEYEPVNELAVYVPVAVPSADTAVNVNLTGDDALPTTVTVPDELIVTVYGKLFTITELTLVKNEPAAGAHPPTVQAVREAVAVPGATGFAVTLIVMLDDEQVTHGFAPLRNCRLVPEPRLTVSVSPTATGAPPLEPFVKTDVALA